MICFKLCVLLCIWHLFDDVCFHNFQLTDAIKLMYFNKIPVWSKGAVWSAIFEVVDQVS